MKLCTHGFDAVGWAPGRMSILQRKSSQNNP